MGCPCCGKDCKCTATQCSETCTRSADCTCAAGKKAAETKK